MGQNLEDYEDHRDQMYREGETLYLYAFENNIGKYMSPQDPDFEFWKSKGDLLFYDHSEQEARKQFKRFFKFSAGKLIRREPW